MYLTNVLKTKNAQSIIDKKWIQTYNKVNNKPTLLKADIVKITYQMMISIMSALIVIKLNGSAKSAMI